MSDFHFICECCGSHDAYLQESSELRLSTIEIRSQQFACGFCNHIQTHELLFESPSNS